MMDRKTFIKKCGIGCFGIMSISGLLASCAGTRYLSGTLSGSYLEIPESAFLKETKEGSKKLGYVVVRHEDLKYPVAVFRESDDQLRAVLMSCTHQGTELQVFGDRLQCPAHGSEFTSSGQVQNGPADEALRTFPVISESGTIKIDLS